MNIIEIEGLSKEFCRWRRGRRESTRAVDGLDLAVPEGGVYGFLGPNGSGKTTTIRCLLGFARPTAGRCRLFARDVATSLHEVLNDVGAIVETPALFPTMSGRRNLELLARTQRIGQSIVSATLERVGLAERADDLVKTYSLGMRQRLGLAAALLKDPALLVLDEPANGLDPAGIREIRLLLQGLGEEGRTVFVSSHLLAEIEHTCDHVAILSRGRCIAAGHVHDVLASCPSSGLVVRLADPARGLEALGRAGLVATRNDGALRVQTPPDDAARVNRILAEAGLWLTELRAEQASLEDVFLALTSEAEEATA